MLDGLISFFASHYAVRAETVLKRAGYTVELIPGPKELSPNCGIALRFVYAEREAVLALLAEKRVKIDEVHAYQPQMEGEPADNPAEETPVEPQRRRRWLPQT
ncbi:MAG: DUF3343 domain-containing protein [Anaerolineae bacterium]|nr:DUF3343 domain-containing protein [Anaerolineae bacterium]